MSDQHDTSPEDAGKDSAPTPATGPFINLKISDDGLEARVTVVKPERAGGLTSEDLKGFLRENDVVYGILGEEIDRIFEGELFGRPVLVAQGKPAVHEKDGEIRYHFETAPELSVDDSGAVDYKELNLIKNVGENEALAEIVPPAPGETGLSVTGKEIVFRKGVLPALPKGKNTKQDPENPLVLLAESEGCVRIKSGKVEIDSSYVIKSNVDYSTGNIYFNGSVTINGDVQSGFRVKVKNDAQINGFVEDAVIEAGGNVLLRNGFMGKGGGMIIAGGDVKVKFCENVSITAEGDITIGDFAMNSRLMTKGRILAIEKTGSIMGGECYAVKGLEINISGNRSSMPTKLHVGLDMVVNAHLEINIRQMKEIENVLEKLSRRKLVKKELPANIRDMIDGLHRIMKEKKRENEELTNAAKKKDDHTILDTSGEVRIRKMAYPGTRIGMYDTFTDVMEARKSVRFRLSKEGLIAENL